MLTRHTVLHDKQSERSSKDRTDSTPRSLTLVLSSRTRTECVGRFIGQVVLGGDVLALVGTLGAGKTTLVRGIAEGLNIPSHHVSSPTFVLAHEYRGRIPFTHIDLYRVKDVSEAEASGLADCFTQENVTAVEWADRFPDWLPSDRLEIRLGHRSPVSRQLTLTALGPAASVLLARVTPLLKKSSSRRPISRSGRKRVSRR
ncbi:MAG: tRNA (adenosine(37)-N6)-threonylcarbamoyltransferase complex ATPase subunit type 1 TsaE [Nitrospira sp.]|nr:tRNA (adenosine(37)-N6)-threonylcarbamoyltransferase complex ATPase subunit type 1 TsaE [Nitrospira sp.]